jgi:histidyl-tRNA synthetase
MRDKGISQDAIEKLQPVFELSGSFEEKISQMKTLLSNNEIGLEGIAELEFIKNKLAPLQMKSTHLDLDITLARGLNYYTGCIFEVAAPDGVNMGSISGGGRYDDLTGIFGMKDMSGVGISFGLDRIYLVLEELDLFPDTVKAGVQALFINFGETEASYCMEWVFRFRESGIKTELFPEAGKMKKQMTYADKNEIPFVILAGEDEIKAGKLTLKHMKTGNQETLFPEDLIKKLKS